MRNFLSSWELVSFSGRSLLYGVSNVKLVPTKLTYKLHTWTDLCVPCRWPRTEAKQIEFFFFFSWRYNPWWVLACFTILFHNLLSLHFSLQFLTFIFFKSYSTWSSHLSLGLPTGLDEQGSHSVSFLTVLVVSILITCAAQRNLCDFMSRLNCRGTKMLALILNLILCLPLSPSWCHEQSSWWWGWILELVQAMETVWALGMGCCTCASGLARRLAPAPESALSCPWYPLQITATKYITVTTCSCTVLQLKQEYEQRHYTHSHGRPWLWRLASQVLWSYTQGVPGGMWNTSGECSLC